MQQVRSSSGFVPFSAALAPFRAVGEHKGQLARAPLFSFHLPLGSAGFHRFHRYYEETRLLLGHGVVVVASFNTSTFVDPKRSPWVRMNGFPPLPSSIPSCHDWISGVALTSTFAQTRRPYKASLSLGAAVSLRLPSHTPSRERSVQALAGSGLMQLPTIYGCLQLAPYGTCTRRHSSMPGAHSRPTGSFRSRRRHSLNQRTHALNVGFDSLSEELQQAPTRHLRMRDSPKDFEEHSGPRANTILLAHQVPSVRENSRTPLEEPHKHHLKLHVMPSPESVGCYLGLSAH